MIVKLCKTEGQNLIMNQHTDCDRQLIAEATNLIKNRMVDRAPETIMWRLCLRTWLEVESILCEEYRWVHRAIEPQILTLTILFKELVVRNHQAHREQNI